MYNLNSYNFGENFRKARKIKGISVADIAKKINKTETTIYKYERGDLMPDIETVLQICNVLGVNFDDLTTTKKVEDTENYSKNPFESNIMYLYYLGYKRLMLFELDFKHEAGFETVSFKDIKTGKIFFKGTVEANQERAYIIMKNFYVANTKFEKVQMILNLTYASDNNYVGVITGTEDKANMPMMKRCIVRKDLIDEKNPKEVSEAKERLRISKEEKAKLDEDDFLTVDITNRTDYTVI